MASNFDLNGTDLDSFFAPYHAGWPQAAATGYEVSGSDLNGRYAALVSGNGTSETTFRVNGIDLNSIFAGAGTTSVIVGTQPGNVSGSAAAGTPYGTVTSNATSCAGAKGAGSYSYTWNFYGGAATFTNPNGASTAVTGNVNAGSSLSGGMYCTISDGVTSVNTNVVSWSLQNTSSFTPVTHTYNTAGSYTETIPTGASQVVIEVWGGSGAGGAGFGPVCTGYTGGGGASGSYSRSTYSLNSGNYGQTIAVAVGAAGLGASGSNGSNGGASSASSGSFPMTTMSSPGGGGGGKAVSGLDGAAGVAGGTASGGNVANSNGTGGFPGAGNGTGGAGIAGVNGTGAKGGNGKTFGGAGANGGAGLLIFAYT